MENDQNVLAFYLDVDPIQEVIAENVPVNEEFLKGFSCEFNVKMFAKCIY